MRISFVIGPKFGDVIYGMHLCRTIVMMRAGICADVWLNPRPNHPMDGTVEQWTESFKSLVGLIKSQPYVRECRIGVPPRGTPDVLDVIDWRKTCMFSDRTIIESFYRFSGVPVDLEAFRNPWMFVSGGAKATKGKVVLARSMKYRWGNPDYAKAIGNRPALFLGFKEELDDFRNNYPMISLEGVLEPANFLEMAELIEGCDEFIGNQSSPLAVAQALGKKRIFERCHHPSDTCNIGGPNEAEIPQIKA